MAKTEIAKASDTAVILRRISFLPCVTRWIACSSALIMGFPAVPTCSTPKAKSHGAGARCARQPHVHHHRGRAAGRRGEGCFRHALPTVSSHQGREEAEQGREDRELLSSERGYGAFERSLLLTRHIDEAKVEAKFDKGMLKITATQKPEVVKAQRKIEIKQGVLVSRSGERPRNMAARPLYWL